MHFCVAMHYISIKNCLKKIITIMSYQLVVGFCCGLFTDGVFLVVCCCLLLWKTEHNQFHFMSLSIDPRYSAYVHLHFIMLYLSLTLFYTVRYNEIRYPSG